MPYAQSLARRDFFIETENNLKIARQATLKKNAFPIPMTDMLLQAVIFKTCARLEEYLKDVISDWLFSAIEKKHFAVSLPEDLRWFCVSKAHLAHYKNFINLPDEIQLLEGLKRKPQNGLLDDSGSIEGRLDPLVVVGDRKYPSVKNIRQLFVRIGLRNLWDMVNRRTRRDFAFVLQSFLDVREAIAHQAPPPLTFVDVRSHIRNVQSFVNAVDRILYSHVLRHHGRKCWRSS